MPHLLSVISLITQIRTQTLKELHSVNFFFLLFVSTELKIITNIKTHKKQVIKLYSEYCKLSKWMLKKYAQLIAVYV